MSGLAAYLQNELVNLSNEAKRKNPEIKEAAERLLFVLRSLKDKQASLPPGSPGTLADELAKSDDIVRPFIMSCDTKNPKLISVAISCLQKLISHHAVPESSTPLIIKTLADQLGSTMDLQLKILQTILPLITIYQSVSGDTLADALLLCYRLQDTKTAVVNSTAAATFRQLVIHAFEKLALMDDKAHRDSRDTHHNILSAGEVAPEHMQAASDAFVLFQDLCLLASGEPGEFLRVSTMPKVFALELVESVLSGNASLFRERPQLLGLLKDRVCPLVIKSFSEKNDFSMTVRLMRVLQAVVKNFHGMLVMECEIFLSMYAKLLDSENVAVWQRVLVLEAVKSLFSEATLQRALFEQYDARENSTRIFFDIVMALAKVVFVERGFLLGVMSQLDGGKDAGGVAPSVDIYSMSAAASAVKIQCIDQLDKTEPPSFPETYPLFLAVQCTLETVDNIAAFTLPILGARVPDISSGASYEYLSVGAVGVSSVAGTVSNLDSVAEVAQESVSESRRMTDASTSASVAASTAASAAAAGTATGPVDGSNADLHARGASKNDQILLAIEMVKSSSPSILAVLTLLSTASVDDEIFSSTMQAFQSYTIVVALLGLTSHRDAFLGAMCKVCVPSSSSLSFDFAAVAKDVSPFNLSTLHGTGRAGGATGAAAAASLLTDRNVVCLRILLLVAECISSVMDNRTWFAVFETLQIADSLMASGKMGRRMESSPGLLELSSPAVGSLAKESLRHRSTTFSVMMGGGGLTGGNNSSAAMMGTPQSFGQQQQQQSENNFATFSLFVKRAFERTVNMEMRHFEEFVRALCRLAHETMAGSVAAQAAGSALPKDALLKVAEEKSFAVLKIHDVALANIKRLISPATTDSGVWDLIIGQLIQMAHNPSCSPSIRNQVCSVFGEILNAAAQAADLSDAQVEMRVLEPIRTIMAVDFVTSEPSAVSAAATAASVADDRAFDKMPKLAWLVEVQKSGLETLNKLLQISGQNFVNGWMLVFDILQNVVRMAKMRRTARPAGGAGGAGGSGGGAGAAGVAETPAAATAGGAEMAMPPVQTGGFGDAPVPLRSPAIVRIGFPCIQLICTDFLALLPPLVLSRCIETVTTFGALSDDLNISLTSVGLLWTICDFILTKRQELDQKRTAPQPREDEATGLTARVASMDLASAGAASDDAAGGESEDQIATEAAPAASAEQAAAAGPRKLLNVHLLSGKLTTKVLDALWMYLLGNLSELCSDDRPEVRNSANQTLFRTLAMNGQRLTLEAWDQCIWQILFPLLERIRVSSEAWDVSRNAAVQADPRRTTAAAAAAAAAGLGAGVGASTQALQMAGAAPGGAAIPGSAVTAIAAASATAVAPSATAAAAVAAPMSPILSPRSPMVRTLLPAAKLWDETKVLTLNGVTKCFLDFLHVLVSLGDSFDRAWSHFLEYIAATCLEGSPEVAMAALKNLRLIIQYARPGATKPVPDSVVPKVAQMWFGVWRTWVEIGLGIIASSEEMQRREAMQQGAISGVGGSGGATAAPAEDAGTQASASTTDLPLQQARLASRQMSIQAMLPPPAQSPRLGPADSSVHTSMHGLDSPRMPPAQAALMAGVAAHMAGVAALPLQPVWSDGSTPTLIHGFFTQDTLSSLMSSFPELFEIVRPQFTAAELDQFAVIARQLLLYHSAPLPGTTLSKLRADFVNDQETLTPLQAAVLDILSQTRTDFSGIDASPEAIVLIVSDLLKLPFVPAPPGFATATSVAPDATPTSTTSMFAGNAGGGAGGPLRRLTYMALAKRALQLLVLLFEQHGSRASIYTHGAFETALGALGIPLRLKYACPSPGTKDSTPLWRSAANAAMTVVRIGLDALDSLSRGFEPGRLDAVYSALLQLFEEFLIQPTPPPASLSHEELSADEAFDMSFVAALEEDILLHIADAHIPDAHIVRMVAVLRRGARMYVYNPASGGVDHDSLMSPLALPDAPSVGTHPAALGSVSPGFFSTSMVHAAAAVALPSGLASGASSVAASPAAAIPALADRVPDNVPLLRRVTERAHERSRDVSVDRTHDRAAEPPALGFDVRSLRRENFSFACLGALFRLCGTEKTDLAERRTRVAEIAAPVLVDLCREIIQSYCADRPTYGGLPMPRLRTSELLFVVRNLRDLQLRAGILQKSFRIPSDARSYGGSGGGGSGGNGSSGPNNEATLVDAIKEALRRVGQEFVVAPV
nr:hypothetical protein HK105_006316 [Polyrhizophydium stewartii]